MKHKLLALNISFLLSFLFISHSVYSQQTGRIAGKVSDTKTGESLIGLTVKITGGTSGASTDVEGRYTLGNLVPGNYSLTFSYIGYQSKNITEIEVLAGKTTTLDVTIDEASSQALQEVVVTATIRQETVNALYAQQKNSVRVSDGISSESIKRSPDKNTGEILKRVSGTTIQDNKFVIVRGLSDRYNSASLDNGVLPSTEPNRKAFSFDIVPANLIDNIVISKTATPDLAGDFAGGSVQIVTKDIPDDNFESFGVGYGYNSQATFKNFQGGSRNFTDYLGFDNGLRQVPNNFPTTRIIVNNLAGPLKNNASLRALPQGFNVNDSKGFLSQNYQFTIGRVKDFEKSESRLGAIVSLSYRNSQNTNEGIVRKYHVFDYLDNQYKFSSNIGALANFAYNFKNTRITLKNIYNRTYDDQYTSRTGTNVATSSDNMFYAFDLIQKSLFKTALEGEHKLGEKSSKIKWTLGFSNVMNDQPDQRKVNYTRNISERNNTSSFYNASITTIGKENTRLFSNLNENGYSGEVNYSLPFLIAKKNATFKAGISSSYRDRLFNVRFLGMLLNPLDPDANQIRQRPLNTLFDLDLINQGKYKLDEIGNAADNYTANSLINSAYVMMDNKLGTKSRLVYGVRVEQYDLNLTTSDKTIAPVSQNFIDILPSVNYTLSVTPKSNFRASYFRTLARPEFRELAPFAYYDYELLAIQQGNPDLQRSLIDNGDLRFEFFPAAGQIFSVSAFYKKFNNAIESAIYDVNSTANVTYFNSREASVYGAELEMRKSLEFLGANPGLKNTTLYTNFSLIKSKVQNPVISNQIETERPLIGQSPYVINAGIQHTTSNNLVNFNLLYNRSGRRIYKSGGQQFPSVYEAPRDVLDFQVGYKIMKSKAEIKLNASDILNNNNVMYFDRDLNKQYSATSSDETISRFRTGSNYSLSFNYSF
ncbi:TonB-dependent receptor domain-containing protein [Daejeonella sp.]|uniref:TonB-dependent receptor n=1 Tax=Daejeonella sp. TaxID=2805397 RepID=UPI003983DA08